MKKILTLVVLMGTFVMGANAQRKVDLNLAYVKPTGDPDNPYTLPCTDSFTTEFYVINNGPDTFKTTDTVLFYSPLSPSGQINLAYTTQNVPKNDTIYHATWKFTKNNLKRLWDATSGSPVYPPFANNNYGYFILLRGFTADTNSVKDPVSDNDEDGAIVKIDCKVGIKDVNFKKSTLNVFPNPANNQISFINEFAATTVATVKVTDLTGRVVKTMNLGKQTAGTKTYNVDIADLNNGMYYIELITDDTRSISKFTKN